MDEDLSGQIFVQIPLSSPVRAHLVEEDKRQCQFAGYPFHLIKAYLLKNVGTIPIMEYSMIFTEACQLLSNAD